MKHPTSNFVQVNNINLHYLDHKNDGIPLLLMHGLTANAYAFDGLVAEGLTDTFRLISPDLRGRGLSDHPAFCYTIADHAQDMIELLDHLKIDKIILGGHSFGGLLSFYIASTFPERVEKVIILDAAAQMNPNAPQMLSYALGRLNQKYPSWHDYLDAVKKAPYNTFWNEAMTSYYKADVKEHEDGSVTPRSNLTNIIEIAVNVGNTDWPEYVEKVNQPALLLNAQDNYTLDEPLLPEEKAKETVEMMPNCDYAEVDGNHQTMLYGSGAKQITHAMKKFV